MGQTSTNERNRIRTRQTRTVTQIEQKLSKPKLISSYSDRNGINTQQIQTIKKNPTIKYSDKHGTKLNISSKRHFFFLNQQANTVTKSKKINKKGREVKQNSTKSHIERESSSTLQR